MKSITESINTTRIDESSEWRYRVAFTGFTDRDGSPITVTIAIPKEYRKEFQKYLEDEHNNTVFAAEDASGYWELDF